MKKCIRRSFACSLIAAAALLLLPAISVQSAQADTRVAVEFFYDDLADHGYWVQHHHYGTVWYPRNRLAGWQPYVYGRWVWTAEYGWYWQSDEPWGWATYHYGRWAYTDNYGWVWVAGDVWGPAWVEWCTSGHYVGWTPLPPEVRWRNDAFVYAGVNLRAPSYRANWVFVADKNFHSHAVHRHRVKPSRNRQLLKASVRSNNYAVVQGRIVNRSVDRAGLAARLGVRVAPTAIVHSDTQISARDRADHSLHVYRPRIRAGARARTGIRAAPPAPPRARLDTRIDGAVRGRGSVFTRDRLPGRPGPDIGVGGHGRGGIGIGGGSGIGIGGGGGIGIGR